MASYMKTYAYIIRDQALAEAEVQDEPITEHEWKAFIQTTTDFKLHEYWTAKLPSGTEVMEPHYGAAFWTGYSKYSEPLYQGIFEYEPHYGAILVQEPDEETLAKMKDLAKQLHAFLVIHTFETD